jgi:hypothetical protein
MTYTKFIRSGDNFEIYEYEKEPRYMARRIRVRKRKDAVGGEGVHPGGENPTQSVQEQTRGKRQDNARHAALAFRRLVASNLSRSEPPLLLTLTYRANITDLSIGYGDFRAFIKSLRKIFGNSFKYVCVPEFQKRGAVHFHALVWGLPEEVFLQERSTRKIAGLWGMGFIYLKQTDGDGRLSSYLSKYMAKAFTDPRLRNQKAYVSSRNITRPTVGKRISPIWPVLDDYVGDDNPAVLDNTYDTPWLGKCRYRLFKVAPDNDVPEKDDTF